MNDPLVSVIIITFNSSNTLAKAIDSVFAQTYSSIEVIVADDCSSDDTSKILHILSQQYPRLIVCRNEKNLGFVANLNRGAGLAKGKYIARLDDDDIWCDKYKLEKQVAFLEQHPEYVLTGGGVIKVDREGKEVIRYLLAERDSDIKKALLVDNVFVHSAVIFRKDAFMKVGGYDGRFGFFADWALWLALGRLGKLYNFQEFFIYYFDKEYDSMSRNRDYAIRRRLRAKIALLNSHKDYYPGAQKALMLAMASYVYSFIPFRKKLWKVIYGIRKLFFGRPPYQYVTNHKK